MVLMLIVSRCKPYGVLAIGDRWVFRWVRWRLTAGQTADVRIEMRIEEERYGVTRPFDNIDYAMGRRQKSVVSPALQDVAAVDDVGILDDRSVNPLSIRQPDRQPWHVVGGQHRHEATIGMGRDAELIFCTLRARRIM